MTVHGASEGRLAGLGAAFDRALQWRLLVAWTAGIALPTAVAAVPTWGVLGRALDHSPRAPDFARHADLLAIEDLVAAIERAGGALAGAASLSALLACLFWPFLAGMTISAARAGERPGFVLLIQGGAAWYWRMFRMLLVSLLPLAAVGGAATLAFGGALRYADRALFESHADWAWRGAAVVTLAFFVLLHATLEAGRAEIGADDDLRSAWRAWLRGIRLTLRRPLAVLGIYLGATVAGLLIAALLLVVRVSVTGASVTGFVGAFVITQLAVAAIGWGRATRLFALVALAQSQAGPKARAE